MATSKGTVEHSGGTSRVEDTTHVVEAPAAVPGTHDVEHDVDTSQVADTLHAREADAESSAAAYEFVEPEEEGPIVTNARITEGGETRITEGGEIRVLE